MKGSKQGVRAAARIGAIGALLVLGSACAPVPRPSVLGDVAQVSVGAAAEEAKSYAPQAYAHAEKLKREADAAAAANDLAGAQLLGERALAAYAHAQALARIARAETAASDADALLGSANGDLAGLEAEHARVSAEADALELKVRVARDAQPVTASGRADPERERARLAAARSLALEARLLCTAARLLVSGTPDSAKPDAPKPDAKVAAQVDDAEAALGKLDAQLAAAPVVAPIDEASRARAGCLAALTAIRRVGTPVSKAPGAGDALLAEISAVGGLAPSRDDRGVFVTVRDAFSGAKLNPAAGARLEELGKIAAAHPSFPIEVVLHTDKPAGAKDEGALRARADAAVQALGRTARGVKITPIVAGNAAPLVDPAGPSKARNARVEVVFVTPEAF